MASKYEGFRESDLIKLCNKCAGDFFSSNAFDMERADPDQDIKSLCTFCSSGLGFDFYIKKKQVGR
jgi:hypothetical protein